MTTLLDPAVTAARTYNDELRDQLLQLTEAVITTVSRHAPHASAQQRLVGFLRARLLPHVEATAEELYDTADSEPTTLLVDAMRDEHRLLTAMIRVVERASDPVDAAIAAGALAVLFDVRVLLENHHLLPALAAAQVDLDELLREVPELVGDTAGERATTDVVHA